MEELARLERTLATWLIVIGVAFMIFGALFGDPFAVITGIFLIVFLATVWHATKTPSERNNND